MKMATMPVELMKALRFGDLILVAGAWRLIARLTEDPQEFVVLRAHNRFSFKVRMKRSATPLPWGSRTKDGEASIPKHS